MTTLDSVTFSVMREGDTLIVTSLDFPSFFMQRGDIFHLRGNITKKERIYTYAEMEKFID